MTNAVESAHTGVGSTTGDADAVASGIANAQGLQTSKAPYRRIELRMWGDEKFCRLSKLVPSGQALWLFLLTGPHTRHIPGLFHAGRAAMAEEIGWDCDAFDRAFDEISRQGMAKADWFARVVWLPNALKCNPPQSPNVVRSWGKGWDLIPECDLKREAMELLRAGVHSIGPAFGKAFDETVGGTSVQSVETGASDDAVDEIFSFWQRTMNVTGARLDESRARAIRAALAMGYSVSQLCRAIRGCSLTPHNMGMNDQRQCYNSVALILRDADQIDRFIGNALNPPHAPKKSDVASISEANAAEFLGTTVDVNVIEMEGSHDDA
jgi:hypothetical protein